MSTELENKIKLKINEKYRYLFPELAASLETYGQLQPILVDDDGTIHDGIKRVMLCGIEQLQQKNVPVDSKTENIILLSSKKKKRLLVFAYHYHLSQKRWYDKAPKLIMMLAERYGVSKRTVYYWIHPEDQDLCKFAQTNKIHQHSKHTKFYPITSPNGTKYTTQTTFETNKVSTEDKPIIPTAPSSETKYITLDFKQHNSKNENVKKTLIISLTRVELNILGKLREVFKCDTNEQVIKHMITLANEVANKKSGK